jgi:hypothetical protein
MKASCSSSVAAHSCSAQDANCEAGPSETDQEQPDLTGERRCFALLITLYALQGSLLGLASGTLPFIIQV